LHLCSKETRQHTPINAGAAKTKAMHSLQHGIFSYMNSHLNILVSECVTASSPVSVFPFLVSFSTHRCSLYSYPANTHYCPLSSYPASAHV
jgi:hypothetical protein